MNDPNKQPRYNDAQEEEDRKPPHKGSKWRKKAGTDEANEPAPPPDVAPDVNLKNDGRGDDSKVANREGYDTAPPPDKAPNLVDYIQHKQDVEDDDEDDEEPTLEYEIDLGTEDDDVTSNAPGINQND